MTVRVAIIGAGVMGHDHARIIAEDIPGARLQVVCDVSEDAARRTGAAFGAVEALSDPLATIQRADVDAVLIASPDATHAELVLSCLELGKPVLCEKPLAETAADCARICEAEVALGTRLIHVGFMRRFDPDYVRMRSAYQAGEIGPALMMHNFHRNVEAPQGFTGLMAITNSAPHEFDAIRYVLGAEVTSVTAFEPAMAGLERGKPVVMVLRTDQGQLATVEVNNNAAYGYDVRGELVGASGAVALGPSTVGSHHAKLAAASAYAADWRPRFAEAYRLQDKAWIKAIQTGRPAPDAASAWDGYCAAAIAEAGVAALGSGAAAQVTLRDRPSLYDPTEAAA